MAKRIIFFFVYLPGLISLFRLRFLRSRRLSFVLRWLENLRAEKHLPPAPAHLKFTMQIRRAVEKTPYPYLCIAIYIHFLRYYYHKRDDGINATPPSEFYIIVIWKNFSSVTDTLEMRMICIKLICVLNNKNWKNLMQTKKKRNSKLNCI